MKERKWTVYIHRNKTNGKVYIGITCSPVTRRWQNGCGYKHSAYFFNAIKKYGWDGFEHCILTEGLTEKEACDLEINLIAQYKSTLREFGYNCTDGGECNIPTSETRKKMSKNHADNSGPNNPNWGKPLPEETRRKLSIANKGKKPSPLTIQRAIEHNTGRKDSPETLKKKSLARMGNKNPNWGKKQSAETKAKIKMNRKPVKGADNPKSRKVVNVNTGKLFISMEEAGKFCSINAAGISKCCRGEREIAGKHPETGEKLRWMYYDDYVKQNAINENAEAFFFNY